MESHKIEEVLQCKQTLGKYKLWEREQVIKLNVYIIGQSFYSIESKVIVCDCDCLRKSDHFCMYQLIYL